MTEETKVTEETAELEYARGLTLWRFATCPNEMARLMDIEDTIRELEAERAKLLTKIPGNTGSGLSMMPYVYTELTSRGLPFTHADAVVEERAWNKRMRTEKGRGTPTMPPEPAK